MNPQIEWNKWVENMLPSFLRKRMIIRLLMIALSPIIVIYNALDSLWRRNQREADKTPQVCSILKNLNDVFDPLLRRFRVMDDKRTYLHLLIALDARRRDVPKALSQERKGVLVALSEMKDEEGYNDFVVGIPRELYSDYYEQIVELINKQKLPSKKVKYIKL